MIQWPHDDQISLMRFYGHPGRVALANVVVPWHMVYNEPPHQTIPHFLMHVKVAATTTRVLQNIWDHYDHSQHAIEQIGMHLWGGAYVARRIRGSPRWSMHAWGAAVDFDPDHNEMSYLPHAPHRMAQPVIDAFKAEGARWGGDYRGRKDFMHFEYCS